MTRFEQEITGYLDRRVAANTGKENTGYWERNAKKEMQAAVEMARADAVVDEEGAISWKSNGHYLMDDLCEMLEYAGYPFSRKATADKRDAQNREFIEKYKGRPHILTDEERVEMEAAFEKGTTVIDVISGEKYEL